MRKQPRKEKSRRAKNRRVLAVRQAWNPAWRPHETDARVVQRKYIQFFTPEQLIQDATKSLVPEWHLWRVVFHGMGKPSMHLEFGADEQGTATYIAIKLRAEDVPVFVAYLVRQHGCRVGFLFWEVPEASDHDGGEELPVPSISESELAAMPPTAGVM